MVMSIFHFFADADSCIPLRADADSYYYADAN